MPGESSNSRKNAVILFFACRRTGSIHEIEATGLSADWVYCGEGHQATQAERITEHAAHFERRIDAEEWLREQNN